MGSPPAEGSAIPDGEEVVTLHEQIRRAELKRVKADLLVATLKAKLAAEEAWGINDESSLDEIIAKAEANGFVIRVGCYNSIGGNPTGGWFSHTHKSPTEAPGTPADIQANICEGCNHAITAGVCGCPGIDRSIK